MSKRIAALAFAPVLILATSVANAGWIDWTSTNTGTMDVGGTSVGVSLTGSPYNYVDGDYYYNNGFTGFTDATGTYGGLAPTDFIQITQRGSFTLTFDQAVDDLYMSMISIGQPNLPVTYSFDSAFSVESQGSNYWGYGGYSVVGNAFIGNEFNGVLKFTGSFTSISFDIAPGENWHGFNFAAFETTSVPEPGSLILLAAGLLGLVAARKRAA